MYEIEHDPLLGDDSPTTLARRVVHVIATLQRHAGARCAECGGGVCAHQVLLCLVLGHQDRPLCIDCLGRAVDRHRERDLLVAQLGAYVQSKECLRTGWVWATVRERESSSPCTLGAATSPGKTAIDAGKADAGKTATEAPAAAAPEAASEVAPGGDAPPRAPAARGSGAVAERPVPDATFDAGDLGCGDLVLELRIRLRALRPRQVLELYARDPAAPEDLPAWCRLTGHTLLAAHHPRYWIRRKEE